MEISYKILCEKNPFLKELQSTFQSLSFDTALAGGCLRDTLLDKPIDDYDVWYCGNFPLHQLAALGFEITHALANPYPEGEWKLTHNAVWQGKKIQFLKCKNSTSRHTIIHKFPNSIGKLVMYWDYLGMIGVKDFKESVENKTIVWDGGYVNQKYVDKIIMKYNDWSHDYLPGFTMNPFTIPLDGLPSPALKIQKVKAPPKKYLVLNSEVPVYKEYSVSAEW